MCFLYGRLYLRRMLQPVDVTDPRFPLEYVGFLYVHEVRMEFAESIVKVAGS